MEGNFSEWFSGFICGGLVVGSLVALIIFTFIKRTPPPKEQSVPISIVSQNHTSAVYFTDLPVPFKVFAKICERLRDPRIHYTYDEFTPLENGLSRGQFPLLGDWMVLREYMTKNEAKGTYALTTKGEDLCADVYAHTHTHTRPHRWGGGQQEPKRHPDLPADFTPLKVSSYPPGWPGGAQEPDLHQSGQDSVESRLQSSGP